MRDINLKEIEQHIIDQVKLSDDELKAFDFFKLLGKSQKEPCAEDDEDCSDFLSECCNSTLVTLFGTLPLEVECEKCKKRYILKDLLEK